MNLLSVVLTVTVTVVAIFFLIKTQVENTANNTPSLGEDNKVEELPTLPVVEEVKEIVPEKAEEPQVEEEAPKPVSSKKPRPNRRKAK